MWQSESELWQSESESESESEPESAQPEEKQEPEQKQEPQQEQIGTGLLNHGDMWVKNINNNIIYVTGPKKPCFQICYFNSIFSSLLHLPSLKNFINKENIQNEGKGLDKYIFNYFLSRS